MSKCVYTLSESDIAPECPTISFILDYAHNGIDRTLCKTDASDFVIPEMDSIGMQQNYLFEIQAPSFDGIRIGYVNDDLFAKSYGYAPRV